MSRKQKLFIFLCGIFLTNALVAEIIGGKIFSAEATLGLAPLQLPLFGHTMDVNLTAGVVIWPFVFIVSDLINEYYGKKGVRLISFLTSGFIAYSFILIFIAIHLPPSEWWINANSTTTNSQSFNINEAYAKVLGQGLRIIVGSLIAFLVSQLIDVVVFVHIRKATGEKWLWLRATGSTIVSQCIDSFVVLYIAFYGMFSHSQLIAIGITNYLYKFVIAILLTPLLYIGHYFIDRYLAGETIR